MSYVEEIQTFISLKKVNFVPKKLFHVSTRLGHHQVQGTA
jgi:hypothetical protein